MTWQIPWSPSGIRTSRGDLFRAGRLAPVAELTVDEISTSSCISNISCCNWAIMLVPEVTGWHRHTFTTHSSAPEHARWWHSGILAKFFRLWDVWEVKQSWWSRITEVDCEHVWMRNLDLWWMRKLTSVSQGDKDRVTCLFTQMLLNFLRDLLRLCDNTSFSQVQQNISRHNELDFISLGPLSVSPLPLFEVSDLTNGLLNLLQSPDV